MSPGGAPETSMIPMVAPRARFAWREGTRTRAAELAALNAWIRKNYELTDPAEADRTSDLREAIGRHLDAAIAATTNKEHWWQRNRNGARMEAAISNLDAAEADLLQIAPTAYVLGQMPSLLNAVKRHLPPTDPRRKEVESIAKELGVNEPTPTPSTTPDPRIAIVNAERGKLVSALRGRARRRCASRPACGASATSSSPQPSR